MIKITKWSGRLSNNLRQINNALHIALFYDYKLSIPKHSFINHKVINDYNKTVKTTDKNIISDVFFYNKKYEKCFDDKYIIKVKEILKQMFIIKVDANKSTTNDLLIYIRSGNIFYGYDKKILDVHKLYVQPPLSYYLNIIDSEKWDNIKLIAEDTLNPVINELLKLHPEIEFKIQSLEEDVKEILSAKTVVSAFGTFIIELLALSNNIKKIFNPILFDFNIKDYNYKYINAEFIDINLLEYCKLIYPWKCTPEQIDILLNYKI